MRILSAVLLFFLMSEAGFAGDLVEPHMRLKPSDPGTHRVALTFDACSGGVDMRILSALISNDIPATLFVTGRWIASNPKASELLNRHKDLFDLEDHGAQHVPAVIGTEKPYGLKPAGTSEAVLAEVGGGAQSVQKTFGVTPHWYRGATALYSPAAISLIEGAGFRIGGFSLNADYGASASAKVAAKNIASARDGDVIIAHMNQPKRVSGAGVVQGILALKDKGYRFVRLDQAEIAAP